PPALALLPPHSLHDALPICPIPVVRIAERRPPPEFTVLARACAADDVAAAVPAGRLPRGGEAAGPSRRGGGRRRGRRGGCRGRRDRKGARLNSSHDQDADAG